MFPKLAKISRFMDSEGLDCGPAARDKQLGMELFIDTIEQRAERAASELAANKAADAKAAADAAVVVVWRARRAHARDSATRR